MLPVEYPGDRSGRSHFFESLEPTLKGVWTGSEGKGMMYLSFKLNEIISSWSWNKCAALGKIQGHKVEVRQVILSQDLVLVQSLL